MGYGCIIPPAKPKVKNRCNFSLSFWEKLCYDSRRYFFKENPYANHYRNSGSRTGPEAGIC